MLADVGTPDEVRAALSERRATTAVSRAVFAILTAAGRAVEKPPQMLPELRRWVVDAGDFVEQSVAVASVLGVASSLAADVEALMEAEPDPLGPCARRR